MHRVLRLLKEQLQGFFNATHSTETFMVGFPEHSGPLCKTFTVERHFASAELISKT